MKRRASEHFSQKGVPVNIFRGPFSRKDVQVSIFSGPFSLLLKCLEDLSKNSIVPARAIYDLDIYCYIHHCIHVGKVSRGQGGLQPDEQAADHGSRRHAGIKQMQGRLPPEIKVSNYF